MDIEPCPECGEPLEFDEVDIGVGVQRGNPRCPNCGWYPSAERYPDTIFDEEE
jgi:ribosomal protein S27AE